MHITTEDQLSLEAQWHAPETDDPSAVVVATHPHPLHGGDMHNTAPATLARELPALGIAVLRFNFRGVGASEGVHDDGKAEHRDLIAAISAASEQLPEVPLVVVGYSFGADVALDTVPDHHRLDGIVAIAPPLRMFESFASADAELPKHLLVPQHDQFRPPDAAQQFTANWTNTAIETLQGTDHFLLGATNQLVTTTHQFVSRLGGR